MLIGSHDKPHVTGVPWVSEVGNFDDGGRFEVTVKAEPGNGGVVGQSNQVQGLVLELVGEEGMRVNDENDRCHQNLTLKALNKVSRGLHY